MEANSRSGLVGHKGYTFGFDMVTCQILTLWDIKRLKSIHLIHIFEDIKEEKKV